MPQTILSRIKEFYESIKRPLVYTAAGLAALIFGLGDLQKNPKHFQIIHDTHSISAPAKNVEAKKPLDVQVKEYLAELDASPAEDRFTPAKMQHIKDATDRFEDFLRNHVDKICIEDAFRYNRMTLATNAGITNFLLKLDKKYSVFNDVLTNNDLFDDSKADKRWAYINRIQSRPAPIIELNKLNNHGADVLGVIDAINAHVNGSFIFGMIPVYNAAIAFSIKNNPDFQGNLDVLAKVCPNISKYYDCKEVFKKTRTPPGYKFVRKDIRKSFGGNDEFYTTRMIEILTTPGLSGAVSFLENAGYEVKEGFNNLDTKGFIVDSFDSLSDLTNKDVLDYAVLMKKFAKEPYLSAGLARNITSNSNWKEKITQLSEAYSTNFSRLDYQQQDSLKSIIQSTNRMKRALSPVFIDKFKKAYPNGDLCRLKSALEEEDDPLVVALGIDKSTALRSADLNKEYESEPIELSDIMSCDGKDGLSKLTNKARERTAMMTNTQLQFTNYNRIPAWWANFKKYIGFEVASESTNEIISKRYDNLLRDPETKEFIHFLKRECCFDRTDIYNRSTITNLMFLINHKGDVTDFFNSLKEYYGDMNRRSYYLFDFAGIFERGSDLSVPRRLYENKVDFWKLVLGFHNIGLDFNPADLSTLGGILKSKEETDVVVSNLANLAKSGYHVDYYDSDHDRFIDKNMDFLKDKSLMRITSDPNFQHTVHLLDNSLSNLGEWESRWNFADVGLIRAFAYDKGLYDSFVSGVSNLRKTVADRVNSGFVINRSDGDNGTIGDWRINNSRLNCLSLFDIFKIKLVLDYFSKEENLMTLRTNVITDLVDKTSEYGGIILPNNAGGIQFRYIDSSTKGESENPAPRQNDRYDYTADFSTNLRYAVSAFHQHAVEKDNSRYAGGSGNTLFGGDLGTSASMKINQVVLSLIDGRYVNIDFVSAEADQIDLGTYSLRKSSPETPLIAKK